MQTVLFGSPGKLAAATPIFPPGEAAFEAREEIVRAVKRYRDRGLIETVKWLCELVVCLKAQPPPGWRPAQPAPPPEDDGDGVYLLGRAYFDAREYLRCHHALRDATEPRSRFLCTYALYLAGETRRQEDAALAVPGPASAAAKKDEAAPGASSAAAHSAASSNPFLPDVCARAEQQPDCASSCYLLGVCLRTMGMEEQALKALARAAQLEPLLWAAWWELARLLCSERYADTRQGPGVDMRIAALGLGRHWMYRVFLAHLKCELQSYEDSLAAADGVLASCPGSVFARTLKALTFYNMREFEAAAALFEGMWREEPYRIADMDVYSNVLYVRGEKAKLSYLAHRVAKTDRYRPESCCVIGNYYSMRGAHVKAVSYFQRALRLNPAYLSAWTLMGHEYMELSNSVAAINCYRRAVDINDRDFRAWYALGQAYEILAMDTYALWYFHKACALRPNDARMWVALGGCFEKTA